IDSTELYWCNKSDANPFQEIENLRKYWEDPANKIVDWDAPEGLFWICGKTAYSKLPKDWRGTCTIGIIQPGFFLLSREQRKVLGKAL
ncbi:ENR1 protein, partial [Tichodroma muraria]|nr:ENR1 protein [Tichodroma muraria]